MEQIFYTKDSKNEIYQCKIDQLVIYATSQNKLGFAKMQHEIAIMSVNVASLGKMVYTQHGFNNQISPNKIYKSVEDAIEGKPMFFYSTYGWVFYNTPFAENVLNMLGVLPSCATWVETHNCLGMNVVRAKTWVWNGVKAIEKSLESPIVISSIYGEDYPKMRDNSYKCLLYDVVTCKFICTDIPSWKTKEECAKANHVKVHTF